MSYRPGKPVSSKGFKNFNPRLGLPKPQRLIWPVISQARSQDFSGRGGGCVWAVKMQTALGGSGGMLPWKNFRKYGVPWTAFYAF